MLEINTTHLERLGWDKDRDAELRTLLLEIPEPGPTVENADSGPKLAAQSEGYLVGRISFVSRKHFLVHDGQNEIAARALGGQTMQACVGDWALCRRVGSGPAVLVQLLTRKNLLSRKAPGKRPEPQHLAANLDVVFLVAGLDEAFNLARQERLVSAIRASQIEPVVVLNKSDLGGTLQRDRIAAASASGTETILVTSALRGDGLDLIKEYVPFGHTAALIGSSGAGKSTLINALLESGKIATGPVRRGDSKGRHTTTNRRLYEIPDAGLLIDMPGIREWQLWTPAGNPGVTEGFADIEQLAETCAFRDCRHESEPGCQVRLAIEAGHLDAARLRSFQKLQHEEAYFRERYPEITSGREDRIHPGGFDKKRQLKGLHKKYRRIQQEKRRRQGR